MAVRVGEGRLTLTGYVGESTLEWDGWTMFDGFTQGEVLAALGELGDEADIDVYLNSGGGYATEGAAIRSDLAGRKGKTRIIIQGIAASAASLIAMAGDEIAMEMDAQLMIHDPSGLTLGTAAEHQRSINALNALATGYARAYASKSGMTEAACRELMVAETWYDAGAAIAAGFVDVMIGERSGEAVAAFPYDTYSHAPRQLVAMAREKGWRRPLPQLASIPGAPLAPAAPPVSPAAPAASTGQQESSMADTTSATPDAIQAAVNADRARRSTIMALPEAQGRQALAERLHATTMSLEDVKATLAAAPAGTTPAVTPQAEMNAASGGAAPAQEGTDPAGYQSSRLKGTGFQGGAPAPEKGAKADIGVLKDAVAKANDRTARSAKRGR